MPIQTQNARQLLRAARQVRLDRTRTSRSSGVEDGVEAARSMEVPPWYALKDRQQRALDRWPSPCFLRKPLNFGKLVAGLRVKPSLSVLRGGNGFELAICVRGGSRCSRAFM
jgi:hypothetical protein